MEERAMQDMLISMAISVLVQLARDPNSRGKWRKALLKVFVEITRAFKTDSDFLSAAKQEFK
jgi:hypothetical protein